MLEPAGLVLFVQVVVMDVIGLLVDLLLWLSGRPTITETVKKQPVLGIPLIIMQLIGVAGLVFHLYIAG